MRFQVERDVLTDAVAWTARHLPARPSVPVLAGLVLAAGDAPEGGVTVSGFDYEVSARAGVDAMVSEEGTVVVSGRLLAEITRSLPAQPVEVVADASRAEIVCGSARFTLPLLPLDEYPSLPELPETAGTIGADAFAAAVASVAVAAGRDDTLPLLTGIRVELEGSRLTLAATDRYRLAVRETSWSPANAEISSVALVPSRTLAETAKSLTSGVEVGIALGGGSGRGGESLIGFTGTGRHTTTRLLEGEFPKYRALLPSESAAHALVETSVLVDAVKRVSLVADRNAPVRLTFSGSELVLGAGSGDSAQASEAVPVQFEGDELTIAFNPAYLLDGLGAVDGDTARLAFTTSTKPAVLTSGKSGGDTAPDSSPGAADDYRYLLMPVRLSG